jgi:flagellar biogenesis protein FliO
MDATLVTLLAILLALVALDWAVRRFEADSRRPADDRRDRW